MGVYRLKTTNGDLVRAMTDEGIARTIGHGCPNDKVCDYMGKKITTKTCEKCWIDWLRQEVNDD